MTVRYMRVKNKVTGHEFDLPVQSFDPEKYSRVDKKLYPETTRPRASKPNVLKSARKPNPVDTEKE